MCVTVCECVCVSVCVCVTVLKSLEGVEVYQIVKKSWSEIVLFQGAETWER